MKNRFSKKQKIKQESLKKEFLSNYKNKNTGMKTKFLFSLLLLLGTSTIMFSQQGVSNFSLITEPVGTAPITPMMTLQEIKAVTDTLHQRVFFLVTPAAENAAKVYIKLGTDSTFSKINTVVNLDGTGLPSGIAITKNGNQYRIDANIHTGLSEYLAEIEVESIEGIKSRKFRIVR